MSKYLDKQALLKWLEQRYQENSEEFEVDRSGEDMEIIDEIESGAFDVDTEERVGTEEWWHKHYGAEWPEVEGDENDA